MTDLDKAILDVLKQAGLPNSVMKLSVTMELGKLTKVECTYYLTDANKKLVLEDGKYIIKSKLYEVIQS